LGVLFVGRGNRADGVRFGVHDLGGARVLRGEPPRAVGHAAVGQRWPVLDHQRALALDQLRLAALPVATEKEAMGEAKRGGQEVSVGRGVYGMY